jgi:hypothetical protein
MYWSSSQKVKEIAFHAVQRYCRQSHIQLLDDYVALNALWCKRDQQGKLRAWRSYLFEFTASGNDRYQGRIVILGEKIQFIQLDPAFQKPLETQQPDQDTPRWH